MSTFKRVIMIQTIGPNDEYCAKECPLYNQCPQDYNTVMKLYWRNEACLEQSTESEPSDG